MYEFACPASYTVKLVNVQHGHAANAKGVGDGGVDGSGQHLHLLRPRQAAAQQPLALGLCFPQDSGQVRPPAECRGDVYP